MYIKDLFSNKKTVFSFEIFPPKKNSPIETIYNTIEGLSDLNPDFISVTYGAGGSNKDRTAEIATLIKNQYNIEALAHLTCISSTKDEISSMLTSLKNNGINNILALRGDLPQDSSFEFPNPLHYQYAKDLIIEAKETGDFSIGAACYPEAHLECNDMQKDIQHLKEKISSGSDFLITQLFFDNDIFYRFMNDIGDIDIPISAGILPVLNRKQIEHITSLCRATLPKKFKRIIEKYEHNPDALREAGIAYATEQIIDLLSWGIEGIHLYTMNKPDVAKKIIGNISSIRQHITE